MSKKLIIRRFIKQLLFTIVLVIPAISFAQNGPIFEQGKGLYKAEKYLDAVNSWAKILENEQHSAALYYNLGNAHYKLNNIGPSIYYYEKALELAPNDSDIKNNLAFAQNAMVDDIEPLPKTIFFKWYQTLSGVFTFDGWAICVVVFSMSFVLSFLIYYFSYSERKKRVFFTSLLFMILFLITSLSMAFLTFNDSVKNQPAIIFSERIEVKSEPNLGSEASFVLHEGTKVQIISRDTNWVRIQIANGKDGWIPVTDLKEL